MGTKTVDEAGTTEAAEVKRDEEAVDATQTEATTEEDQPGTDEVAEAAADEEAGPTGVGQGAGAVVSAALGLVSLTGSWIGTVAAARETLVGQLETSSSASVAKQVKEVYGDAWQTTALWAGLFALAALIVGVFPALRATGAKLRGAMGSIGSGAKAQLGATWTVLIVAQVAITVVVLPPALLKGWEMIQQARRPQSFTAGEYLASRFVVESEMAPAAIASENDAAAADTARAIMHRLIARLATEPGVAGGGSKHHDGCAVGRNQRGAGSRWQSDRREARRHPERGHELLQAVRRADARRTRVHGE
jgi:hypothetical protein